MFLFWCLSWYFFFLTALSVPYKTGKFNNFQREFLVSKLPGLNSNIPEKDVPLMFSGQLKIFEENNTHLYYWKFVDQKKLPENNKRTVFWLNGGPGCSSMDGALMEAGPFRINADQEVTYNNGSWHKLADIVFVDQPAGTGFSYSNDYSHDLDASSKVFLTFLKKYFELFPEDKDNDVYLAGESYAGQYIPYIADLILKDNENHDNKETINLKGLLIGNGYVSPIDQGLSYLPFSHSVGILKEDNPRWGEILDLQEKCQKVRDSIDSAPDFESAIAFENDQTCENILTLILTSTTKNERCINMYDYTLSDTFPSCGMNWPPDLDNVRPFLRDNNVMNNLNLENKLKWKECSSRVSKNLASKIIPSVYLLPKILEKIPVFLFNGDRDIICNYIGTEYFINSLRWNGKTGFSDDIIESSWIYNGQAAGYMKQGRNLTFVNVYNASHMVPFDKPKISRALIDLITRNYDIEEFEGRRSVVTYEIGERSKKLGENPSETLPNGHNSTSALPNLSSQSSLAVMPPSNSSSSPDDQGTKDSSSEHKTSKITRLIQFVVVLVLIWGVYVLYSSYRWRPSSIIKSGSSSGRKKNVQWADQLRSFENEPQNTAIKGFFSKTLEKLKGGNDDNGNFAPVGEEAYENIEMGDHIGEQVTANGDDFIIGSDDEDEHRQHSSVRNF